MSIFVNMRMPMPNKLIFVSLTIMIAVGAFALTAVPASAQSSLEGCTPGYWKQSRHWDNWEGYAPSQTLEAIFDVPDAYGMDSTTLLQALNSGGGGGAVGGARILLRASVAALLNAASSSVEYGYSTADVIAQVNAALASGNRTTMLDLAAQLDRANNAGCPLGLPIVY